MFLSRLELLFGKEAIEKLRNSSVLVAGLGGVGGICAEALVRCGIGRVGVIDGDKVEESNLNRQILSLNSTIGMFKTDVFEKRAKDINPEVVVEKYLFFLSKDNFNLISFENYNAVADCIDSLIPKVNLIIACLERGIPVVSSAGSGFRKNPEMVKSGSVWEAANDPLIANVRKKLKKWGYENSDFTVVYSEELPQKKGKEIASFMPVVSVFGLIIASKIIEILLNSD